MYLRHVALVYEVLRVRFLCSLTQRMLVRVRRPLAFSIVAFGSSVGGIIYPIIFKNLVASVGYGPLLFLRLFLRVKLRRRFKWTVRTIAFINLATFIVAGLVTISVCESQRV